MAVCCVVACKNRSDNGKNENISFHRFPNDRGLKKAWTIAVRRRNFVPNNNTLICSDHFTEDCFRRTKVKGRKRRLIDEAIPTIFPTHIAVYNIEKAELEQVDTSICNASPMDNIQTSGHSNEQCNEVKNAVEYLKTEDAAEYYEEIAVEYINEDENCERFCDARVPEETLNVNTSFHNVETVIRSKSKDIASNVCDATTELNDATETNKNEEYCLESVIEGVNLEDGASLLYRLLCKDDDSEEVLKEKLNIVMGVNVKCKATIKSLQQRSRRLSKNICKVEKFVNHHRASHILSATEQEIMKLLPGFENEILTLQLALQELPSLEKLPSVCIIADAAQTNDIESEDN